MTLPAHVIILGCGRSGTSIFGELFDHLSTYHYLSEPPFEALLSLNYAQPTAIKVPKESKGFPPDTGLSFPLSMLLSTIPQPRHFFWQVRHPLDTICSLKVGISRNWGHHPQPPDWKDWVHRPLIEQCAHHWNYINTIGFSAVAEQVVVTRFEDMLANSYQFAAGIAQQVSLNEKENASEILAWAERVQNRNNEKFVEAETSRAYSTTDHSIKVGRWKENLSDEEISLARPIIEETARRFGYTMFD
uniref:Sulfotransferase n=1 Tax=Roseihalotalea indica TaxID=2867963 RepID=A0AA49GL24_9BACT|nr:hypothetical protein K4G66_31250 [Tunicatimonas sp. TK19036]